MNEMPASTPPAPVADRRLIFAAAGLAAANVYYNQPMLAMIEAEARARLSTVLMGSMFLGSAFGSAAPIGA